MGSVAHACNVPRRPRPGNRAEVLALAKETAAAEAKAAERDAELAAKAAEDEAAKSDEKKDELHTS